MAINIRTDKKRPNIIFIDGREVNKDNYPEGFDFNLLTGTKTDLLEPVVDFGQKVLDIKIVDPE